MATGIELKRIVIARVKSAEVLMDAEDWSGAAYMLGYTLECALKSCVCKALRLKEYPGDRKRDSHFMVHNFDQLLILSGMSDVFNITSPGNSFQNWSEFTKEYPGDWPGMRYNEKQLNTFDEAKVKQLYNNINSVPDGILAVIKKKKRW